ncbi:hypothetical protein ANOM_011857 [Aspergillus nomiae NRRL 13137]|uniref:Uncharacterized protein n=1 Tax=Aspergillus nomiae NRRL (strain ATCC 15546 / NRRL 13137 / CBS 260.88 / M93) TaxID=1509407 RepID=A0A0L1IKV1_ASPN3|nr:uncharacterized protein ANOM_011857 [Aspergillus nomiae NRRL 13137]KNG79895.1 hypothetical protein ANOM_011857 [Aspergillus nomiae NRRL 13137]
MPALEVPVSGLSLHRDNPGSDSTVKPTQIMRLNLAQSTLDELIQTLRDDQTARVRLGKHPTLYYGSKSQPFHSHPETHRSEIYSRSSNDKENLYFTGVLSHSLEVQKAKEATAATDQALANLEQSLNAFERGKESKKTHIITSIDEVRALRAGDKRQAALLARKSSSKPGSGCLSVSYFCTSPHSYLSTASQTKDRVRLDALKVPFIHLLAVRAVSAKFLARQTRSSIEDCTALARKYGAENRINPEKFDLKDKAYRELDVWNFPYPSQEERQEAIENAISAFDRMRISRTDKLWQMLLPKEERGKGKCLSRLNLRTGPVKKPLTPRIQVQNPDESGKDGDTTGPETDRVNGNGLTPKTQPTSAPRSGANAQKKRVGNSVTKQFTAKGKNTTNSTLTGRVTKKPERKPVPKPDGKFKSAEYVHDSDEDDTDIPDASASEQPRPEKTKLQPKVPPKQAESSPRESPHVPTPKVDQSERAPSKAESSPPNPPKPTTSSKRPPSSRPPAQKSPQKPSPLGSSPPTNASDLQSRSRSSSQNNSSSSSSSPLITQISKPNKATGASNVKKQVKTNGMAKATPALNPLKRKAELDRPSATPAQGRTTGDLEHKRRRAVSTSSGSTGSASPPLSREILLQQLREKSQRFKHYYAKYRTLHDTMAAHSDPPRAELEKLRRQHFRLQQMKEEIWDEDRRLREGL